MLILPKTVSDADISLFITMCLQLSSSCVPILSFVLFFLFWSYKDEFTFTRINFYLSIYLCFSFIEDFLFWFIDLIHWRRSIIFLCVVRNNTFNCLDETRKDGLWTLFCYWVLILSNDETVNFKNKTTKQ